jgi:hypothetical protein
MMRMSFRWRVVIFAAVLPLAILDCAGGEDVGGPAVTPPPADDTDPGSEVSVPPDDSGDPGTDSTPPPDDTAPPTATYPAGPYGKTVGSVIANLSWKGYRNGTGAWGDIALLDYYDPDGTRGYRALKINLAALW